MENTWCYINLFYIAIFVIQTSCSTLTINEKKRRNLCIVISFICFLQYIVKIFFIPLCVGEFNYFGKKPCCSFEIVLSLSTGMRLINRSEKKMYEIVLQSYILKFLKNGSIVYIRIKLMFKCSMGRFYILRNNINLSSLLFNTNQNLQCCSFSRASRFKPPPGPDFFFAIIYLGKCV